MKIFQHFKLLQTVGEIFFLGFFDNYEKKFQIYIGLIGFRSNMHALFWKTTNAINNVETVLKRMLHIRIFEYEK